MFSVHQAEDNKDKPKDGEIEAEHAKDGADTTCGDFDFNIDTQDTFFGVFSNMKEALEAVKSTTNTASRTEQPSSSRKASADAASEDVTFNIDPYSSFVGQEAFMNISLSSLSRAGVEKRPNKLDLKQYKEAQSRKQSRLFSVFLHSQS